MNRDELVEAMAEAIWNAQPRATRYSKLAERMKEEPRLQARAALAVAEPVVRADERDECVMRLEFAFFAHGSSLPDYVAAIRAGGKP